MKTIYLIVLSFFFVIFLTGVSSAAPNTLYVDVNTGNDSNDGSQAHPWSTINHAANQVASGDTVLIASGNYYITENIYITTSGNQTNPVTFRGVGNNVVIDGSGLDGSNYEKRDAIYIDNANYVVVENLEIKSAYRAGIRISESDYVTIRNVTSHNNGNWGIFTGFSNNLLIENCECYGSVNEHGIYTSNSGDNPTIRGNILHDNNGCGLHMNGDVSMGGDGIISGALVENNIIYNNGYGGGSGINCDGVINSIIRNNLLYNNHASGISLYCIDGGSASNNNQVYQNTVIVAIDGRWALNLKSGSSQNKIYNNILLNNNPSHGSITTDSITGLESDYNVLTTNSHPVTPDDDDTYPTFNQWQAMGFDQHSIQANSLDLFTNSSSNDYSLKIGSLAIDIGTSLYAYSKDILGNHRPFGGKYDIGAYENIIRPGMVCNERTWELFSNIQAAISSVNTTNDDNLVVYTGTFTENIIINKLLNIRSWGNVTVNPANISLPVVSITSSASGTTLQGFNIKGSTNCEIYVEGVTGLTILNNTINGTVNSARSLWGICLVYSNGVNITNNTLINCEEGINLYSTSNSIISRNIVKNNHWDNIALNYSILNTIKYNTIFNADSGIRLINGSNNNTISSNNIAGNVWTSISLVSSFYNQIISGNILSNNQVGTYLYDSHNNTMNGNVIQNNIWDGIGVHDSSYNTITEHSKIFGNNCGVYMVGTSNHNTITMNTFTDNVWAGIGLNTASVNTITLNNLIGAHVGISMTGSSQNNIIQNNITSNDWDGIDILYDSNENVITFNTINGSYYGERIIDSSGNIIHHNNFVGNTVQASDNASTLGINQWDNGSTGNYYNDWITTNPRPVDDGASVDNHPQTTSF